MGWQASRGWLSVMLLQMVTPPGSRAPKGAKTHRKDRGVELLYTLQCVRPTASHPGAIVNSLVRDAVSRSCNAPRPVPRQPLQF